MADALSGRDGVLQLLWHPDYANGSAERRTLFIFDLPVGVVSGGLAVFGYDKFAALEMAGLAFAPFVLVCFVTQNPPRLAHDDDELYDLDHQGGLHRPLARLGHGTPSGDRDRNVRFGKLLRH
jgi:hypothetical protein